MAISPPASAPVTPITPTGTNTVHATIAAAVEVPPVKPLPALQPEQLQKKWLKEKFGTEITAYVTQVGEKEIQFEGYEYISQNPFFAANQSQI